MRSDLAILGFCIFSLQHSFASARAHVAKRDAPYEQVNDHPGWSHQNEDKDDPDKYFHESSFSEHYDGRFATEPLIYEDRRSHLTALLRTYISSMRDMGAETWIMHGSLLGWYWNGKILPWDGDLDVMVSEKSLHHLASFYNMSVHHFSFPEAPNEPRVPRNYLLEVNPHYKNASVESVNKIDARWIDTETGLFIDITTLRRNKTARALGEADAMMVKDKHHYSYDDIFPLRSTLFEGVPVNVPFAYADILIEEYGEKSLSDVHFQNHRFDVEKQEWRALSCKDFNTCGHFRNAVDRHNYPAESEVDTEVPAVAVKAAAPPLVKGGTPQQKILAKPKESYIPRSPPARLLTPKIWQEGRWQA